MTDKEKCVRCKGEAETYDFETDSSFWGAIITETTTRIGRRIRIMSTYYRRNPKYGSSLLNADEKQALCSDCWGLFIGRFLQGRDVPAMPGKQGW